MKLTDEEYKENVRLLMAQRQSLFTVCTRGPDAAGMGDMWLATTIYRCDECHMNVSKGFTPQKYTKRFGIDIGALAMGIVLGKATLTCPHAGPFMTELHLVRERRA